MRRASISVCLILAACAPETPRERLRLEPSEALGSASTDGYERAVAPRRFEFPVDHGPHPEFRTEWWYATGNLMTNDRRRFGYQLTVFRNALRPDVPAGESAWRARDLWFAHFAVTDVEGERLHGFERFARGALGLAGARAEPFRVWLEEWEMASTGASFLPLRVVARAGEVAIDLELTSAKDLVLQGVDGLSQKSGTPGNASYYYSYTRLASSGIVRVRDDLFPVTGTSWLDREWSTSALGESQQGWDWFALQLDDGRELMFYRLRGADGSSDPASAGTLVEASGVPLRLALDDVELRETATWRDPGDGAEYPSRWRMRLPAHGLDLEIEPVVADQAHDFVVRYWEGAVDVRDASGLRGTGYVELTGY